MYLQKHKNIWKSNRWIFSIVRIKGLSSAEFRALLHPMKCLDDGWQYLSTKIPACTAWTMLRNRGFSSGLRRTTPIFLVKVEASQSRTSRGTESAWMSLSSSSESRSLLQDIRRTVKCSHSLWMSPVEMGGVPPNADTRSSGSLLNTPPNHGIMAQIRSQCAEASIRQDNTFTKPWCCNTDFSNEKYLHASA